MRTKLIFFVLLICALALGAALTGCKKSENNNEKAGLLLLFQSSQSYFPEIPKGVAE